MRALLLVLVMPFVLQAQVRFDPRRLDDSTALSYAVPSITADPGALMCLWASTSDSTVAAYGRRVAPDGNPLGGVVLYDAVSRDSSNCPPSLSILHTESGGEVRLIYHSCNAVFLVRFISAGGQITDSLCRARAVNPAISRLTHGVLLAYNNLILNEELLLWLQDDGAIVREDTVNIPNVEYVYAEGMQGKLVAFTVSPPGPTTTETFVIHTCNDDGTVTRTDTLLADTLQSDEMDAGHDYDYRQGSLTAIAAVVQQSVSPLVYTLRVMRYANGTATVYAPWETGPVPVGSYIQNWSLAHGAEGFGVVGYYVRDENSVSELRFEAFDAVGQPTSLRRTIPLLLPPSDISANGLDAVVDSGTVYPLFTLNAGDATPRGGVYLAAFPLSDILAVRSHPQIVPQSFGLTAYPNPFNSAVRIEYQFPVAGGVALRLFDVTGRLVGEHRMLNATSGHGEFLWAAAGLPSGVYMARLSGGNNVVTAKLFLIR